MNEENILIERDVPIPMRDGVMLRANIFRARTDEPAPVLVNRTPYGKSAATNQKYLDAGYAVVTQDIRGRYASDGEWTPFSEPNTLDGLDGYDTIEWLAGQSWCNGRVGTFGASYDGWLQWQAARHRPPHLVAMVACSIPLELTDLDYPGSFRLARRLHWWFATMAPDVRRRDGWPSPHRAPEGRTVWHDVEQGLRLGTLPVAAIARAMPPSLAKYAAAWLADAKRRPWQFEKHHADIDVPNLDFSGWFDHCTGLWHLPSMQKHGRTEAARGQTKAVIGPWNHTSIGRTPVNDVSFGEAAVWDLAGEHVRWFDYWLKGIDNGVDREPALRYFVVGSGEWKQATTWPLPDVGERMLFLAGDGKLADSVAANDQTDEYIYDPCDPTPTIWTQAVVPTVNDRRTADHRRDVLRYVTEPLAEDVEIAGVVEVRLFASSSARDTDFFAHLSDDDPEGIAMEVAYGMVRARHRNGLDREELIEPGEVVEYVIRLTSIACRFRKGHRIRMEIASSSFPHYDRNHNTGGNDLFEADMVVATQRIYRGAEHPSAVALPVVE